MNTLIVVALGTVVSGLLLTLALIPIGRLCGLVDDPERASRKKHDKPTPLVGGSAIVAAIVITLVVVARLQPDLLPQLGAQKWAALGLATCVLLAIGFFDDRFDLPPRLQIIGPIAAALCVIFGGVMISTVTDPRGGALSFMGLPLLAGALTFAWLVGMMYSTKLLDGLDGLSCGLSGIGAFMIFALTHTPQYYEPRIGFLALVFASACVGFLLLNFHPARAFLGEGGSLFMGFGLGILAILSGSKIATTLLVMGLPVLDVARVMIARRLSGVPIARGDSRHLHHLLIANGLSHRGAVVLYFVVGIVFGTTALFLQSREKIVMLGLLVVLGIVGALYLEHRLRRRARI